MGLIPVHWRRKLDREGSKCARCLGTLLDGREMYEGADGRLRHVGCDEADPAGIVERPDQRRA